MVHHPLPRLLCRLQIPPVELGVVAAPLQHAVLDDPVEKHELALVVVQVEHEQTIAPLEHAVQTDQQARVNAGRGRNKVCMEAESSICEGSVNVMWRYVFTKGSVNSHNIGSKYV